MTKEFDIGEFIEQKKKDSEEIIERNQDTRFMDNKFSELVEFVQAELDRITEKEVQEEKTLERQRKALLGNPKEVDFYKTKIKEIVIQITLEKIAIHHGTRV